MRIEFPGKKNVWGEVNEVSSGYMARLHFLLEIDGATYHHSILFSQYFYDFRRAENFLYDALEALPK